MFSQQPATRGNGQVCNFYLKGQCKYGTQCWNLHPPNQGNSAYGGNVFGAKMNNQSDSREFIEFVKQVSGEMNQWERSGQWLLSSFTPLKSHPLLAGFSDLSPEELRLKAYDALKTNTSASYQDHWNKLQQQYKQLRDALKQPTPEAYQAVKDVFHAKGITDQLQNSSPAAKSSGLLSKPTTTLFGSNAPSGTGLLGPKIQPSVFGGGGSLFGGNQSTSSSHFGDSAKKTLFGGSATVGVQNTSTFGNQSNTAFGGGSNLFNKSGTTNTIGSSSVFGGGAKIEGNSISCWGPSATVSSTPGNVFGGSANSSVSTLFGGSGTPAPAGTASVFGGGASVSTPSIFGGNTTNTASSKAGTIFGGNTSTTATTTPTAGSVFGGGTSNPFGNSSISTFGNVSGMPTAANSVFGGGGNQGSIFGNNNIFANAQNQNQQLQQSSANVFGNPATSSAPTSIFGMPSTADAQPLNASQPFGLNTAPVDGFEGTANTPTSTSTMQNSSIFGQTNESKSGTGLFGQQSGLQPISESAVPNQLHGGKQVPANVKSEWFTPLEKLDPADKCQFEAEEFTFVPLCPPPLELCF